MEQKKRILVKRQTDYMDEKDLKKMKNVIYTVDKYMLPPEELLLIDDGTVMKAPNLTERANELIREKNKQIERQKAMKSLENAENLVKNEILRVMENLEKFKAFNENKKDLKIDTENMEKNKSSFAKSDDKNLDDILNEFLNGKVSEDSVKFESDENFEPKTESFSMTFLDKTEKGSGDLNKDPKFDKNKVSKESLKDEKVELGKGKFEEVIKAKPVSIHKDHRSRLKNQFLSHGISSLSDIQKLEMLLFYSLPLKDTNPLAHELINKFGSLKDVFDADISSLISVSGVKENTATLIKLVSELCKTLQMPVNADYISSVGEAKEFCTKLFANVEVEQFYIICLSKSNRVKRVKLLQSGSSDEIMVQIRNVTEFALESKCNRIIISHNHPCGFGKMSDEDCTFTYSLICSCILNSIDVVDHIIVGTDKTISLASQNILPKLKEKAVHTIHLSQEKLMMLSNSSEDYKIDE